MESRILIDSIVRQTTVLIAAISTASGIRAPLAHIADQIFLDLAREIESHGVSRKVIADMFGLALRTYQKKVRRLSESTSARNRSLWEAVYQHVLDAGEVSREALEARFGADSQRDLAAVIHDLVASGQIEAEGRGKGAVYRAGSTGQTRGTATHDDPDALPALVWGAAYLSPETTLQSLVERWGLPEDALRDAVRELEADGRIQVDQLPDGDSVLRTGRFVIPVGSSQGWEAAVFDHFSTMAAAIATKLQAGPESRANDRVGGATLSFDLCDGHPYELEVYGLLANVRAQVNELWERVSAHNRAHPSEAEGRIRVSFYFGQNVQTREPERDGADA